MCGCSRGIKHYVNMNLSQQLQLFCLYILSTVCICIAYCLGSSMSYGMIVKIDHSSVTRMQLNYKLNLWSNRKKKYIPAGTGKRGRPRKYPPPVGCEYY